MPFDDAPAGDTDPHCRVARVRRDEALVQVLGGQRQFGGTVGRHHESAGEMVLFGRVPQMAEFEVAVAVDQRVEAGLEGLVDELIGVGEDDP